MIKQNELKRYKLLETLIKSLTDEKDILKGSFRTELDVKEEVEQGALSVYIKLTERASLSKDKIVTAFSKKLSPKEIVECLNSIPKSLSESVPVEFVILNSEEEIHIKKKADSILKSVKI